jgi:hypothetical protein
VFGVYKSCISSIDEPDVTIPIFSHYPFTFSLIGIAGLAIWFITTVLPEKNSENIQPSIINNSKTEHPRS